MARTVKDRLHRGAKIPSTFKKHRRRTRRSREKTALLNGRDLPLFKKSDDFDWW